MKAIETDDQKVGIHFAEFILKTSLTKARIISYGSSGAEVLILSSSKNKKLFALKFGRNLRVSLYKQLKNRAYLSIYMGKYLPKLIKYDRKGELELALFSAIGHQSLLEQIIFDPFSDKMQKIWAEVVTTVRKIWQITPNPYNAELDTRLQTNRVSRIKSCFESLFSCLNYPVIINGYLYPSINDLFNELLKVQQPSHGVLCHGDITPNNIIPSIEDDQWNLVDFEWVGSQQNWRMSVAQMYGSWVQHLATCGKSMRINWGPPKVEIELDVYHPSWIQSFQKEIINQIGPISISDQIDINLFLATLYIGEIRFCEIRNRKDLLPAFIGQALAVAFGKQLEPQNWVYRNL